MSYFNEEERSSEQAIIGDNKSQSLAKFIRRLHDFSSPDSLQWIIFGSFSFSLKYICFFVDIFTFCTCRQKNMIDIIILQIKPFILETT